MTNFLEHINIIHRGILERVKPMKELLMHTSIDSEWDEEKLGRACRT
jgi:hypothetical protein